MIQKVFEGPSVGCLVYRCSQILTSQKLTVSGGFCTFGVGLTGNLTGSSNPFAMNSVYANRQNSWKSAANQCGMSLDFSFSFVEVCAGMMPYTTAQVQTSGAYPTPIGFDWLSTSQTGVDTGCRGGVVSMTRGAAITLVQSGGGVFSGARQTRLVCFQYYR